jgi:hypothetical protein
LSTATKSPNRRERPFVSMAYSVSALIESAASG